MSTCIWHGLHLAHPADWEMLQYAKDPASGRCAFADRRTYRLELNWRRFDGPPDFERMLSDYGGQLRRRDPAATVRPIRRGPWRGLATTGKASAWRLGRYFDGCGALVELVFLWPGAVDDALVRNILGQVREERPRDGLQRWRCFGMDLKVEADLPLGTCRVEPARAMMGFGAPDKASVHSRHERLGLVPHWLGSPVRDWLDRRCPHSATERRPTAVSRSGHRVELLEASVPAPGLGGRWRRRCFQAAAWQCAADGRLYCLLRYARADAALEPRDLLSRLHCCERFGVAT